jgi:hypothetical protein
MSTSTDGIIPLKFLIIFPLILAGIMIGQSAVSTGLCECQFRIPFENPVYPYTENIVRGTSPSFFKFLSFVTFTPFSYANRAKHEQQYSSSLCPSVCPLVQRGNTRTNCDEI